MILSRNKSILITKGIIFVILGILAIALPTITTYSITILVGILFLLAGITQAIWLLKNTDHPSFWFSLITAALAIIIGILILIYPLHGAMFLTLLLGIWFMVHGIVQIAVAIQARGLTTNWGLMLFSGIISIILALIIWSGWPATTLWVIGLLLGINLLLFGIALLAFAFRLKNLPEEI